MNWHDQLKFVDYLLKGYEGESVGGFTREFNRFITHEFALREVAQEVHSFKCQSN